MLITFNTINQFRISLLNVDNPVKFNEIYFGANFTQYSPLSTTPVVEPQIEFTFIGTNNHDFSTMGLNLPVSVAALIVANLPAVTVPDRSNSEEPVIFRVVSAFDPPSVRVVTV